MQYPIRDVLLTPSFATRLELLELLNFVSVFEVPCSIEKYSVGKSSSALQFF